MEPSQRRKASEELGNRGVGQRVFVDVIRLAREKQRPQGPVSCENLCGLAVPSFGSFGSFGRICLRQNGLNYCGDNFLILNGFEVFSLVDRLQ
jgi:hypothetical protein